MPFNKAPRAITITITNTESLHQCRHHDISTLNDHEQHNLVRHTFSRYVQAPGLPTSQDYNAAAQTNIRQRDAQVVRFLLLTAFSQFHAYIYWQYLRDRTRHDTTRQMSVAFPPLYFYCSAATIRFYDLISSNALQTHAPPPHPPPAPPSAAHNAHGTHDSHTNHDARGTPESSTRSEYLASVRMTLLHRYN